MIQHWPPSPCVEDEEVALAKELGLEGSLHDLSSDNQPASTRGSVDQYPIIIDCDASAATSTVAPAPDQADHQGAHDGPLADGEKATSTVPVTNHEMRFVYIPSQTLEAEPTHQTDHLHRSKSTTELPEHVRPRERPQVPRLQTDVGAGLGAMPTGHRHAPSLFTSNPPSLMESFSVTHQNGDKLLSPTDARRPRRPLSAHPGTRFAGPDDSDSDREPKPRRRSERSRSRADRQSFSQSDRSDSERHRPSTISARQQDPDNAFSRYPHRHRIPGPRGAFNQHSYTGQDRITPPETPKPIYLTTKSAAGDHSTVPESADSHHGAKRVVTDSPYASSAEEAQSRLFGSGDERRSTRRGRSRRGSRSHVDSEDKAWSIRDASRRRDRAAKCDSHHESQFTAEHHRQQPRTPGTPRTMEDYFEKAFVANRNKRGNHADSQSRPVSPLTSPPQSPPRTPRRERSPRDYIEPPSSAAKPSRPRSRPPSWDDSHFRDMKPLTSLLGAATLGASLAAKAIPALTRSANSHSGETPSSGSQSHPSSGQRSRKSSPVQGEPPSTSHNFSNANSTAIRDEGRSTRTTTYTVHENRALPLSATYTPTATLEPPRPSLRAASYSHSYSPDLARPPILYRAHSSTTSPSSQGSHPIVHYPVHQPASSAPMTPDSASSTHLPQRPTSLPTCPRSRPVAGLHDWYTIRDLPHLDFCPTCMGFLGASRFRDHFIPSLPKDPRQPVVCSMSFPWLRVAWIQTFKQDKKDLFLLWQISTPPPQGTLPCPGPKADLRRWYHLADRRTGRPVENFDICSACVRNLDLVFPRLQNHLFDRPANKPFQEKVCNLNTNSRHFFPIILELERLADRREKGQLMDKDLESFTDFIRRISRHRECAKDTMLATSSWHYIPELPELTICEECFEEVVWPLRDRPIAREVCKTLRIVPALRRSHLVPGISCQLYSDRMRKIFFDAVNRNDFEGLKAAARHRYSMEHRLQELQKLYDLDQKAGIDRRAEREKNIAIWKSIE